MAHKFRPTSVSVAVRSSHSRIGQALCLCISLLGSTSGCVLDDSPEAERGAAAQDRVSTAACASSTTTILSPGDDLGEAIESSSGSETILLNPGTYDAFVVEDKRFTAEQCLVVKKNPAQSGEVVFDRGTIQTGTVGKLTDVSYIAFEGLSFTNGLFGVRFVGSDHIILKDLELYGLGQEAISLKGMTHHVDVLGCTIYETGRRTPKYGEGIYIGSAPNSRYHPDDVHHIWVEGCDISETGAGEGVDIKGSSHDVTLRGNEIHDIVPGNADKWNNGLIVVEQMNHTKGGSSDFRNIWLEDNHVYNQRPSANQYRKGGIYMHGAGVYAVGNLVEDAHDYCYLTSDLHDSFHPVWLWDNTARNCGEQDFRLDPDVDHRHEDPGPNPLRRQTWYQPCAGGSCGPVNLALDASTSTTQAQEGKEGALAVDGDARAESRWSAQGYPQTLSIDLGQGRDLSAVELLPLHGRAYQYTVKAADGRMLADRRGNTSGGDVLRDEFGPQRVRTVRVEVTGCHGNACSSSDWVSLREVRVWGEP